MTAFDFIITFVANNNEIHFCNMEDKSVGMIPAQRLVDTWKDAPVVCEDTFKANPMPENIVNKILASECMCIGTGRANTLTIYIDIDVDTVFA